MKRLFTLNRNANLIRIKDTPHSFGYNITHPSEDGILYFDSKSNAKTCRNLLNDMGILTYISKGPDHIGSHGNHNPKRINKAG